MSANISSKIEKEYIIDILFTKKIPLSFFVKEKYEFTGTIIRYDAFTITVQHNCKLPLSIYQKLNFIFFVRDNRHMFTSTIKSIVNSQTFVISFPDNIVRNIQRRFQRVTLGENNVEVTFQSKIEHLDFPETTNFKIFDENLLKLDSINNIQDMIDGFRRKMSVFSKNAIVIFKNRNPSTIEEFLIVKTGKAFYIPNSFKYFPDSQVYDIEKVIVNEDIVEYYKLLGNDQNVANQKINQLLLLKQKKNILSELYYPMIYKKFVIGYLYLMNETDKNSQIAFNIINNLEEFSKLLIASLIKNSYFTRTEYLNVNANIVDISAGGMQFYSDDNSLASNLFEKDELQLNFRIENSIFSLKAFVRRRWKEQDNWHYGVQFDDTQSEQIEILKNLIYKKS
ncbi:MAG TPA: PilZ domain-containing protein [Exilispira sp.]|nr:PilZ domain-containing protein [Exilispira sp.]